jgi:hypothetical protein
LLQRRFTLACSRLGLATGRDVELDVTRFRSPGRQGSLF